MSQEDQISLIMEVQGMDKPEAERLLADIALLSKTIAQEVLKENEHYE